LPNELIQLRPNPVYELHQSALSSEPPMFDTQQQTFQAIYNGDALKALTIHHLTCVFCIPNFLGFALHNLEKKYPIGRANFPRPMRYLLKAGISDSELYAQVQALQGYLKLKASESKKTSLMDVYKDEIFKLWNLASTTNDSDVELVSALTKDLASLQRFHILLQNLCTSIMHA
jgi:hypothetical protein